MPRSKVHVRREPLILATGNAGKLREFRQLLDGLPFEVFAYADFDVTPPDETGETYLANALLKARHAAAAAGMAAIADDSGLEVDALGGAPGVHSARYAGLCADDAANNAKLLAALESVTPAERGARYRCVIAFVAGARDPQPLTAEGVWEGRIVDEPRGSGGFGYDRYFWLPDLGVTAAELAPEQKNHLSHRGAALRALGVKLAARARMWPRESG
jgi:XTP/dITP diphosphohydrolase